MNDRLLYLHDGELGDDEATRLRAELTDKGGNRAVLDAMDRVDRTLVEVDRLIGPSSERIESGEQTLKALLRDRVDEKARNLRTRSRRPVLAMVGGALAAAAAVAIWVAWPDSAVVGTVQYHGRHTLSSEPRLATLSLGSVVQAPSNSEAHIQVPGAFEMTVGANGEVRIGGSATDLRLVGGWAVLQTAAEVTLHLGDGPYYVVSPPHSTLRVRMSEGSVALTQQSGTSVLVAGQERRTLEAGTTVRLDLTSSSLTGSDGAE